MVTVYYLDTSALVKQYVDETGSTWLRNLVASGSVVLLISHILVVEMISAFNRRLREGVDLPFQSGISTSLPLKRPAETCVPDKSSHHSPCKSRRRSSTVP